MELNKCSSDILINIFSYLSVIDSTPTKEACKRFFYIIEYFQEDILVNTTTEFASSCMSVTESSSFKTNNKKQKNDNMSSSSTTERTQDFNIYSEVLKDALSKVRCKPNIVLLFTSDLQIDDDDDIIDACNTCLPYDAPMLCVDSSMGTVNNSSDESTFSTHVGNFHDCDVMPFIIKPHYLCRKLNSTDDMKEILFPYNEDDDTTTTASSTTTTANNNDNFEFFFIFSCGDASLATTKFLSKLQTQYPNATIIGGICTDGLIKIPITIKYLQHKFDQIRTFSKLKDYVLSTFHCITKEDKFFMENVFDKNALFQKVKELFFDVDKERRRIYYEICYVKNNQIFGYAMRSKNSNANNSFPIQAFASRGVKSLTAQSMFARNNAPTITNDDYIVQSMETIQPNDERYPYEVFVHHDLHPMQMIHTIKNITTNEIITPFQLLLRAGISSVEFVGFKNSSNDDNGYHLLTTQRNMFIGEDLAIELNNETIDIFGDNLGQESRNSSSARSIMHMDYFDLNATESINDLTTKLHKARDFVSANNKRLLGTIMISCCARDDFIKQDNVDSKIFSSVFPNQSCFGFYANGEIGPRPLAIPSSSFCITDSNNNNCNAIFQKGNVSMQGYAVMCVMIIVNQNPDKDRRDEKNIYASERQNNFDDHEENVKKYVKKRLSINKRT